jgi:hypothetical protein
MSCTVPVASAQVNASVVGAGQHAIHDANRDGTCDECGSPVGAGRINSQGQKAANGKHYGPGDCAGNQGTGPRDGSGYGAQSGKRSGPRDGTGIGRPQGAGASGRGGRRGGRS